MNKGLDLFIFSYEHESRAFRPMKFMCRRSHAVDFNFAQIMDIVTNGLNRIRMKISAKHFAQLAYSFNIQQVTNLIVGVHQRYQRTRTFLEQLFEMCVIHVPILVKINHRKTDDLLFCHCSERMLYGMMFNSRGDNMLDIIGIKSTGQNRIIRLGAAGSKNDLARSAM